MNICEPIFYSLKHDSHRETPFCMQQQIMKRLNNILSMQRLFRCYYFIYRIIEYCIDITVSVQYKLANVEEGMSE